jgi:hypothetical protein
MLVQKFFSCCGIRARNSWTVGRDRHDLLQVPVRIRVQFIGENGRGERFEPSTSWSRTKSLNPINALSGVAYGTQTFISLLLVVRNLYVN